MWPFNTTASVWTYRTCFVRADLFVVRFWQSSISIPTPGNQTALPHSVNINIYIRSLTSSIKIKVKAQMCYRMWCNDLRQDEVHMCGEGFLTINLTLWILNRLKELKSPGQMAFTNWGIVLFRNVCCNWSRGVTLWPEDSSHSRTLIYVFWSIWGDGMISTLRLFNSLSLISRLY